MIVNSNCIALKLSTTILPNEIISYTCVGQNQRGRTLLIIKLTQWCQEVYLYNHFQNINNSYYSIPPQIIFNKTIHFFIEYPNELFH